MRFCNIPRNLGHAPDPRHLDHTASGLQLDWPKGSSTLQFAKPCFNMERFPASLRLESSSWALCFNEPESVSFSDPSLFPGPTMWSGIQWSYSVHLVPAFSPEFKPKMAQIPDLRYVPHHIRHAGHATAFLTESSRRYTVIDLGPGCFAQSWVHNVS